jgi:small subunit ribosomal protein S20
MPRSKSVLKRQRQSENRRVRNLGVRSALKTYQKRVRTVADEGGDASSALKLAQSRLDKAAARGVIHKNKASRTKSRLAKAAGKASS